MKTIRAVIAATVILACFAVFTGLQFHDLAVVPQSEVPALALHAVACVAALLLVLAETLERGVVARNVGLPVLALAAVGGLGLALAAFHPIPAMTLTGSLEHGVGALWFLETAILAVAASVACESPRGRAAVRVGVALSMGLAAFLQVADLRIGAVGLQPYSFAEWMGFTLPVAAACLFGGGRLASLAGAALLAVAVVWSDNRTVYLVLAAAGIAWVVLNRTPLRARPGLVLAAGAPVAALVALVALIAIRGDLEGLAASGSVRDPLVASSAAIDQVGLQEKSYGTLWQRAVNMDVAASAVKSDPHVPLRGLGFGAFDQVVAKAGHAAVGRYFAFGPETASKTYWDGDAKARFHSHNLLMDMLISLGVGGAALWLAFLASIGASSRRPDFATCLLVSTFAVGGSFWFFVNTTGVFLAIAVALTASPARRAAASAVAQGAGFVALVLGMLLTAGYTAVSAATVSGEHDERYFVPAIVGPAGPSCQVFWAAGMPSQQINTWLYSIMVNRITTKPDEAARREALKTLSGNLTNFSCLMRTYAGEGDVRALETSLAMRGKLIEAFGFGDPMLTQAIGPDMRYWRNDLGLLLLPGTRHEDLVMPYVAYVEKTGTKEQLDEAIASMKVLVGVDGPVGHWLEYRRLVNAGDAAAAKAVLAEALDEGLANVHQFSRETIEKVAVR